MDIFIELEKAGIIPVIKINRAEDCEGLARALKNGGLPVMEITFRTEAAEKAVRLIARSMPEILVLAGTISTVEQAKRAIDAGAQGIVSPGINPDVVSWCIQEKIPVIPGCATPTEIEFCKRAGLKAVKLFPAEVIGGVKMLKVLAGPYADMRFMPTGGINSSNVGEYLSLPNVICCGGSWMATEELIDSKEFKKIEDLAREAKRISENRVGI